MARALAHVVGDLVGEAHALLGDRIRDGRALGDLVDERPQSLTLGKPRHGLVHDPCDRLVRQTALDGALDEALHPRALQRLSDHALDTRAAQAGDQRIAEPLALKCGLYEPLELRAIEHTRRHLLGDPVRQQAVHDPLWRAGGFGTRENPLRHLLHERGSEHHVQCHPASCACRRARRARARHAPPVGRARGHRRPAEPQRDRALPRPGGARRSSLAGRPNRP